MISGRRSPSAFRRGNAVPLAQMAVTGEILRTDKLYRSIECPEAKQSSPSGEQPPSPPDQGLCPGAKYKKILRLSYDVIITYDNRKSNLR